jgi:hypothetical protein
MEATARLCPTVAGSVQRFALDFLAGAGMNISAPDESTHEQPTSPSVGECRIFPG